MPIRITSYNCRALKSSIDAIHDLCETSDIILLQETWLRSDELHLLSTVHSQFYGEGISSIDIGADIVQGRPYGGLGILWRKNLGNCMHCTHYGDNRLFGIECTDQHGGKLLLLNVYLPYNCDENFDEFCEYLAKIDSIFESSNVANTIAYGDFNADPNS